MKKLNAVLLIVGLVLMSTNVAAQDTEKVFFAKTVPTKIKIKDSYEFTVGYIVNEDSDVTVEVSGGPEKFWLHQKKTVKTGPGILKFNLSPEKKPTPGNGYRMNLSIRPKNGNWQTTRAGVVINNLEFVSEDILVPESVSFSPLTANKVKSSGIFNFDIDYVLENENIVQVAIWNDKQWLGSSKQVAIQSGKGTQNMVVKMDPPEEGFKYKYVLMFGTQEEFNSKQTKIKELSGIQVYKPVSDEPAAATVAPAKPEKQLTLKEINEKSIQLAINKSSELLTLPGAASFEFIKIISTKGEIVLEEMETNSVNISTLTQGAYFAITSEGDYYKFVKL